MKKFGRFLKKLRRISVGFAMTAFAVAVVLDYVPSEVVKRLDYLIYDVRLRAIAAKPEIDPRIVIVDIDEKSLAEEGRWPWSREVVAKMVTTLTDDLNAAVVGFDIVFAEPQESDAIPALDSILSKKPQLKGALDALRPALQSEFDRDAQLATTLRERPVVLGYYFNQNPNIMSGSVPKALFKEQQLGGLSLQATDWLGFGANLPVLQKHTDGGFFNPILDEDGTVRSIPLVARYEGGYYQSLALAVIRRAMGNPQVIPVFPEGVPDDYGAVEYFSLKSDEVELDIPVERGLVSLVNFRARGGPEGGGYRYISATDVLNGRLTPEDISGKIVLVGTTAPGLLDLRSTPVNPAYPGVEVHANVLSSILDQHHVLRPEYAQGIVLISVLAVGLTLSILMPLLSATWSLVIAVLVLIGSIAVNSWFYFAVSCVVPVAVVLLLVLAIFMFDVAYGYLSESKTKKQMVNLFGEYVAPELVTEMAADPTSYNMEGEIRDMTVLFSDVRGFTTISESLQPNELREYINEYLTVMSEIIRNHRGTLDKYIGDAIMAFWGAPIPDKDHARLATQAAIAMQEEAVRLNERFKARNWPVFAMGVGLNTGPMRVGDMGSKIRRAYTVMGDAVNLGSRLEGITKTYGVGVMVGQLTKDAVGDFAFEEMDKVKVKGKDEPVSIFLPLGEKNSLTEEQKQQSQTWHQALADFRAQKWEDSLAGLEKLEQATGPRELYNLYRSRIAYFKENPPPAEWDGVTKFDTK